jgi:hypothetical protein
LYVSNVAVMEWENTVARIQSVTTQVFADVAVKEWENTVARIQCVTT